MKTLNKQYYVILLICLTFIVGCGNGSKSKDVNEIAVEKSVQNSVDNKSSDHTYDIIINAGSSNEQHLKGEIKNSAKNDGTINNFSVYSNTENGKGIVLRIGNDDLLINGLFFQNENGSIADLFDGSEDDSEEKSNLIISIAPPSNEVQNSMSGDVKLSNIKYALETDEGGAIGYTLVFNGQFEDYEDKISQIKGTVVVRIPNNLL